MSDAHGLPSAPPRPKRADARRNERALLDAAAAVFGSQGVDAPVRAIASQAGVGVATIYRHFPTRAELVEAVYRHQVDECAAAGPRLLDTSPSAEEALREWIGMFVEFLVTKHGLADAMRGRDAEVARLHGWFVDRLVPVCDELFRAAAAAAGTTPAIDAYALLRGVGDLCAGARGSSRGDVERLVQALVSGALAPVRARG
jgi:AcrR family transcriptional regulator